MQRASVCEAESGVHMGAVQLDPVHTRAQAHVDSVCDGST